MTLLEGNGRDRMEIFKTGFFFSSLVYTHHKKIHVIYIAVNWVLPKFRLEFKRYNRNLHNVYDGAKSDRPLLPPYFLTTCGRF